MISKDEAAALRDFHDKVSTLLAVDDFTTEELARSGTTAEAPKRAAKKKTSARKKVSKKKTTRKKAKARKKAASA